MMHSPQSVPKQKSPQQIVPSLQVYFPFPCIWASFIEPQYLSPFAKVIWLDPYGKLLENQPVMVNSGDLYEPLLDALPFEKSPQKTSLFDSVYLPFPSRFPFLKFPSRTLFSATYLSFSFSSSSIVIVPFPSKFSRSLTSPLKLMITSLLLFFLLIIPFTNLPLSNTPWQKVLDLSMSIPFPVIQFEAYSPSYTYSLFLNLPDFGTPSAKCPSKVAPFLKVSFPFPSGFLYFTGPLYYSLLAKWIVLYSPPMPVFLIYSKWKTKLYDKEEELENIYGLKHHQSPANLIPPFFLFFWLGFIRLLFLIFTSMPADFFMLAFKTSLTQVGSTLSWLWYRLSSSICLNFSHFFLSSSIWASLASQSCLRNICINFLQFPGDQS